VSELAKNPEQFREKFFHLSSHQDETSRDEIEFKDGSVMDRYSAPVRDRAGNYYGRIWAVRDVTDQKRLQTEIEQTHQKLLLASRRAGMAEVATGILHNVGNVLNSINVASISVAESVRTSNAHNLIKVVALLREHESDLGAFLVGHPQGKHLVGYLDQLARFLMTEQTSTLQELSAMQKNVDHVKNIITMQQSYAKVSGQREAVRVSELIEDALKMNAIDASCSDLLVSREFSLDLTVTVEKHRALQILVNLVRNAREACQASPQPVRKLAVRAGADKDRAFITVSDNGAGIAAENLGHIFSHGFTTKKDGHGFGLHSAALTAAEMGGRLSVQSDGPQCGASFTLELPTSAPAESN
jgi:C4-dicarboxylate-specific signal transduction histidine kinase